MLSCLPKPPLFFADRHSQSNHIILHPLKRGFNLPKPIREVSVFSYIVTVSEMTLTLFWQIICEKRCFVASEKGVLRNKKNEWTEMFLCCLLLCLSAKPELLYQHGPQEESTASKRVV